MQSLLNLQSFHGLPLTISGFTHGHHHRAFAKEMVDHDLRREAMKKQRSQARERLHANQEMDIQRMVEEDDVDGDLACLLSDLFNVYFSCAAKAA